MHWITHSDVSYPIYLLYSLHLVCFSALYYLLSFFTFTPALMDTVDYPQSPAGLVSEHGHTFAERASCSTIPSVRVATTK
jgi:hypothetical protein